MALVKTIRPEDYGIFLSGCSQWLISEHKLTCIVSRIKEHYDNGHTKMVIRMSLSRNLILDLPKPQAIYHLVRCTERMLKVEVVSGHPAPVQKVKKALLEAEKERECFQRGILIDIA